jgi:hypothetical protein
MTIPASLIDSTGLLGMALAFRAASGELPMPDDSGDQNSSMKPWEAIKVDEKKTSSERSELLEKQIALLEKEIKGVQSNTSQRRELTKEIKMGSADVGENITKEDHSARQNPLKKNKSTPGSGKKGKAKAESKAAKSGAGEKPEEPEEGAVSGEMDAESQDGDNAVPDEADDGSNADAESAGDVAMAEAVNGDDKEDTVQDSDNEEAD